MVRLLLLFLLVPAAAFAGGSDVMSTGAGLSFPTSWRLMQLTDEWVIYTNSELDALPDIPSMQERRYVVAIKRATLKRIPPRGHNLIFLPSPPCLKRLPDAKWTDRAGFPISVRRFEARYECK